MGAGGAPAADARGAIAAGRPAWWEGAGGTGRRRRAAGVSGPSASAVVGVSGDAVAREVIRRAAGPGGRRDDDSTPVGSVPAVAAPAAGRPGPGAPGAPGRSYAAGAAPAPPRVPGPSGSSGVGSGGPAVSRPGIRGVQPPGCPDGGAATGWTIGGATGWTVGAATDRSAGPSAAGADAAGGRRRSSGALSPGDAGRVGSPIPRVSAARRGCPGPAASRGDGIWSWRWKASLCQVSAPSGGGAVRPARRRCRRRFVRPASSTS
jgi:hypothetical protein